MKPLSELPYLEWTEPDTGEVSRLYADVITDESANLSAQVTQHAVETGAKITDHYRKDNESVTVTYYFSGAPLRGDLDFDNLGFIAPVSLTYPGSKAHKRPNPTQLEYRQGPGPGLALLNPQNAIGAAASAIGAAMGIGQLPKTVTPADVINGQGPGSVNALTFEAQPKRLEKAIETVRRLQTLGILVTVKTTFGPFENCGILSAEIKRTVDHGTSGEISFSFQQLRFVSSDIALALPLPVEPRAIPKASADATGADTKDGHQESTLRKLLADGFGIHLRTPAGAVVQ